MEQVICARDNHGMSLVYQCVMGGHPTYRFRCPRCNGQADIQVHEGQPRHVRVGMSDADYRPQAVGTERFQIPVAYTLGAAPASSRAPAQPPPIDEPAFTLGLGQGGHLTPADPMHPHNLRRRLLGV